MTVLVQRLKDDVGKLLSGVSTEVQTSFEGMVDAVQLNNQEDLVDVWKKIETHFQVGFAHFAVSAGDELLRWFLDVQRSVEKS